MTSIDDERFPCATHSPFEEGVFGGEGPQPALRLSHTGLFREDFMRVGLIDCPSAVIWFSAALATERRSGTEAERRFGVNERRAWGRKPLLVKLNTLLANPFLLCKLRTSSRTSSRSLITSE